MTSSDIEVSLGLTDQGLWYVEWTQDDDQAVHGYRSARWYGSRLDCVARMMGPPPALNDGNH